MRCNSVPSVLRVIREQSEQNRVFPDRRSLPSRFPSYGPQNCESDDSICRNLASLMMGAGPRMANKTCSQEFAYDVLRQN
jgi:hypothetical protein